MENKILIAKFDLIVLNALRVGGSESGEIFKDENNEPLMFGSSIGGAIRSYLRKTKIVKIIEDKDTKNREKNEEALIDFMGGEIDLKAKKENKNINKTQKENDENKDQQEFQSSSVFISDAKIEKSKICKKEGTRINSAYKTAEQKSKYEFEYLDKDAIINFEIETEVNDEQEEIEFKKIIETIKNGFDDKEILLGGQKSNDFGAMHVENLEIETWDLSTLEGLQYYINEFSNRKTEAYIFDDKYVNIENKLDDKYVKIENKSNETSYAMHENLEKIKIEMTGLFPYGVYQNFKLDLEAEAEAEAKEKAERETKEKKKMAVEQGNITGIQKNKIPASTLKGILRHFIEKMFLTLENDLNNTNNSKKEEILKLIELLFGSNDRAGLIHCCDIKLDLKEDLKVERLERNDQTNKLDPAIGDPMYVKINRFTGGNIDKALITQREKKGEATINISIDRIQNEYGKTEDKKVKEEKIEYEKNKELLISSLFPIIYAMTKIGRGQIPIGGKSSIGLGEFKAKEVIINGEKLNLENFNRNDFLNLKIEKLTNSKGIEKTYSIEDLFGKFTGVGDEKNDKNDK